MKIKPSKELKKLGKSFFKKGEALFVVGGFVRDAVRGVKAGDVDVASAVTPDKIEDFLPKGFSAKMINEKLGTVLIRGKRGKYEHTTFRTENYLPGGKHIPEKVVMTNSLEQDSARRDFTMNALYYNLSTKQLIDLYCGVADINNRIVRQINADVFKSDGLRILRMIRFAVTLGYHIDETTLACAKANIDNLKDISAERKFAEIEKIILAGGAVRLQEIGLYKDADLSDVKDILSFGKAVGVQELRDLKAPGIRKLERELRRKGFEARV